MGRCFVRSSSDQHSETVALSRAGDRARKCPPPCCHKLSVCCVLYGPKGERNRTQRIAYIAESLNSIASRFFGARTKEDIEKAVEKFTAVGKKFGVVKG